MRHILPVLAVLLLAGAACPSPALPAAPGERLSDFIDRLNARGSKIVYSTDLVTPAMRVTAQPQGKTPAEQLANVLAPFDLAVRPGPSGSLLVVRDPSADGPTSTPTDATSGTPEPPLPEIVVTSSLHRLEYTQPVTHTYLDRDLATRIPAVAEEAVRLTDRLPGTASGGVSTRNHVRGGEANEVLFLLDGLRLYEPYHMKDFQAIATVVNASAIDGIDFFTGAFPARFGDRMSGVMSIDLRQPSESLATELSLSFFNTSALSLGTFGAAEEGDWLVSARRGNMDVIVDVMEPEYGSPKYHDIVGRIGWSFGPHAALSGNLLYSRDKLSLFDPDRGEAASADYKNEVYWLKWGAEWSDKLASDTIVAYSDITNRRQASLELPGIVNGELTDDREFRVLELRQDWEWLAAPNWLLRAGADLKRLDATYRVQSQQSVSAPFDAILDNRPHTERVFDVSPSGAQYAAYLEGRWRPAERVALEAGVRWDQQTYTTAEDDTQVSPRLALLFRPLAATELRIGWGRHYQAQEINELQLSDGVGDYYPAQRAEHFVGSVQQSFPNDLRLEISAYRKKFGSLRPRFENVFNTLTLVPELQFDRVRIAPLTAEAVGAELLVSRGGAGESLFWWLGYAWSSAEDETAAGSVPRSWDQVHTAKGGVSWRWGDWNFSGAAEYHSGWPQTDLGGELMSGPGGDSLVLDVGDRNADAFASFHILDVRVSRDFRLARGSLTTFLEISNLYDRANPCCTEYSLASDGSLAAKQGHWLPLVPSLGVVWRF
ncbi:MAG TPA: TonB-dependent receptor [Woeseiaceae bacterium]|nr:TonB-dependent receptor [Woeseiaceae bacterium]